MVLIFKKRGVETLHAKKQSQKKVTTKKYKPRHSSWMGSSEGFRDTSSSGKVTLTTRHFGCITGNQIKAISDTQISLNVL